jgi:hypothetical protein
MKQLLIECQKNLTSCYEEDLAEAKSFLERVLLNKSKNKETEINIVVGETHPSINSMNIPDLIKWLEDEGFLINKEFHGIAIEIPKKEVIHER